MQFTKYEYTNYLSNKQKFMNYFILKYRAHLIVLPFVVALR